MKRSEAQPGHLETSKMENKMANGFQLLTIVLKVSILEFCGGPNCASEDL